MTEPMQNHRRTKRMCALCLDLLASFRELPPHVRDRLVLCFGPQTWIDVQKELESRYLVAPIGRDRPLEQIPENALAQFAGYWCYGVYDYGPSALFVRLGPPPAQEKAQAGAVGAGKE